MLTINITKLASAIEMSFDVPDSEKQIASTAEECFQAVINSLIIAKEHLDVMYNPFKKYDTISQESLTEKAGLLNRFKQKVKENFSNAKAHALKAIQSFNYFSSDAQVSEMLNSFKNTIEDVEKEVVIFMDVLDNYKSPDFKNNIILSIDNIKKHTAQVEKLVEDRIINYIDVNILSKNWVSNTGKQTNIKIEDRVPLITELFNERQQALDKAINMEKRPETLNPGNIQRVWFPQDARMSDNTGEY